MKNAVVIRVSSRDRHFAAIRRVLIAHVNRGHGAA
jgi:hypothetical protein